MDTCKLFLFTCDDAWTIALQLSPSRQPIKFFVRRLNTVFCPLSSMLTFNDLRESPHFLLYLYFPLGLIVSKPYFAVKQA